FDSHSKYNDACLIVWLYSCGPACQGNNRFRMRNGPARGREAMKDPIHLTRCAELLGALAAPERLRIVRLLAGGERNVTEIAGHLHTAAVNVAHHLGVLKQAGVVRGRKEGRFVYYSLAPGFVQRGKGANDYFSLGGCRLEVPRLGQARRPSRTVRLPTDTSLL